MEEPVEPDELQPVEYSQPGKNPPREGIALHAADHRGHIERKAVPCEGRDRAAGLVVLLHDQNLLAVLREESAAGQTADTAPDDDHVIRRQDSSLSSALLSLPPVILSAGRTGPDATA
jgi:hypothetical protein